MANVELKNLTKTFGKVQVIKDVSLHIDEGEFVVFVGPSGCGKSTLLRMIAGLEGITTGTLEIGGVEMNDVPASKRGIAMVFQSYALYPHLSVADNMGFSLSIAKVPKPEIRARVEAAAEKLQLTPYLDRLPKALSGGQRQRVAIGRTIVREPEVFLFDEPLSNLDAELRVTTRREIAALKAGMPNTTMVYVTHDQVEAMTLADKIVVLRDGIISQVGSPIDLYERPENTFVAQFIGSPKMNFFAGDEVGEDSKTLVGIRPEHMSQTQDGGIIEGVLSVVENLGEYTLGYFTTAKGTEFTAKMTKSALDLVGQSISFTAQATDLHRFDAQSQQRLG